ncbi:conserved hypothetical protein [Sphingomonas sp. EC-HK361]|uniref:glycosyltransferase n=1 Tax=Sphingomonas sp. EC-HK361 TaxID=2038397 RepID=UPI001251F9B9|nr:glycosyltransferase [Sphingomonas sp. EC-HK361]VVT13917.1 conserved hypothetical protein [Sphingomonas sp. EC-HK361]
MASRKMPIAAHILSYAQTLDGGGVERAFLRLARGWLAEGRRVTLALGCDIGPLHREIPAGLAIVPLRSGAYHALFGLPAIVRREAPDILFCPGNHYTSVALWTRMRLGRRCPLIVAKASNAVARGDHDAVVHAGHAAWLGLHGRFLDHVVAMTPATADAARKAMRIDPARVSVIPNPPAEPIAGAPTIPLPPGPFIVGVGRLVPQKRWDRLIAALPRLAGGNASLLLIGDGPLRDDLKAQAASLGMADRVYFAGHVLDPLPAIASARVLALTSDYEGVPGVLREALGVGTPVVTTDCTEAIPEIVTSPALGTVVAPGDDNALVSALETWLAPSALRPTPVTPPGADSALRYLALFDRLVSS